jgi:hypothetical protein
MDLINSTSSIGQVKIDRIIGYNHDNTSYYDLDIWGGLRIQLIQNILKYKFGQFKVNYASISSEGYYDLEPANYDSSLNYFYLCCICQCGAFSYDTLHEYNYYGSKSNLQDLYLTSKVSKITQCYHKDNCHYEIVNDIINKKTKIVMVNKSTLEVPILDLNIYEPEKLVERAKKLRAFI